MARGIALAVEMTKTEGGELRRVIGAAVIGNALEWYDFVIYSFLATTIASIFFPDSDESRSPPRDVRHIRCRVPGPSVRRNRHRLGWREIWTQGWRWY